MCFHFFPGGLASLARSFAVAAASSLFLPASLPDRIDPKKSPHCCFESRHHHSLNRPSYLGQRQIVSHSVHNNITYIYQPECSVYCIRYIPVYIGIYKTEKSYPGHVGLLSHAQLLYASYSLLLYTIFVKRVL